MKQAKKMIWVLINLLGGTAVIGSYVIGFLTQPNASQALWGGVPVSLRPVYTACMFVAAAGYFALAYFILRLDPGTTRVFDRFGFGIFNVLYLLVLVPSALWMPLTLLSIQRSSAFLVWLGRLDLALVAAGSLGLLLAVVKTHPRPSPPLTLIAVVGSLALCLQTVILDAFIWSIFFK